ncbi:MAG TPA: chemotaxis response regulator protein-glutamate methylesterase [bacterium]|nr:chemotaxis response regulator protein-glutamate methylesterase [bacterium]
MTEKISIMIVDDSALMRSLVSKFFDGLPDIKVAGTAMDGQFALKKLNSLKPHLIILDLEMPRMNGIEFLKNRQKLKLEVPVIILSSLARKGASVTMEALALGASDFVLKPSERENIQNTREQLIQLVRIYGRNYRHRLQLTRKRKTVPASAEDKRPEAVRPASTAVISDRKPGREPGQVELIAIGISTGGPNALRSFLPNISSPQGMLIVQHMPAGFTKEFAESLNKICPMEVKEAEDGDLIKAGRILVAPGDQHLTIEGKTLAKTIKLSDSGPVNGHRPSADVLFEAVARHYENRSIAAIMTGMGKDGASGIGSIYRAGSVTLAQDEASCVVFGMPRIAIERGVISRVVPLQEMARTINELAKEHS